MVGVVPYIVTRDVTYISSFLLIMMSDKAGCLSHQSLCLCVVLIRSSPIFETSQDVDQHPHLSPYIRENRYLPHKLAHLLSLDPGLGVAGRVCREIVNAHGLF